MCVRERENGSVLAFAPFSPQKHIRLDSASFSFPTLPVFLSFFSFNFSIYFHFSPFSLPLPWVWCERDSTLFSSFSQTSFRSQTISGTNRGKGTLVLLLSMVTSTHFNTTSVTHFVTGTVGLVSMSAAAVTPAVLFTALAGLTLVAAVFCGVSR